MACVRAQVLACLCLFCGWSRRLKTNVSQTGQVTRPGPSISEPHDHIGAAVIVRRNSRDPTYGSRSDPTSDHIVVAAIRRRIGAAVHDRRVTGA